MKNYWATTSINKVRQLAGLAVLGLVALGFSGPANASLVVQGTVEYMGATRNLIYDDHLDITWLDYTQAPATWSAQQSWAAALSLTINGMTFDNWRLPSVGPEPLVTGYNQTNSEMGHLFYTELGLPGGQIITTAQLNAASVFDNLVAGTNWTGSDFTPISGTAWYLLLNDGYQGAAYKSSAGYALAVLPGQIQAVPEPAALLLINAGLAGLLGLAKRQRGR